MGAGRKPGFAAKSAEEARRILAERVAQEIGPIGDMLLTKAKKGDIRALRELLDRAWGRPFQAVLMEVSEEEEARSAEDDARTADLVAGYSELARLRLTGGTDMNMAEAAKEFTTWYSQHHSINTVPQSGEK